MGGNWQYMFKPTFPKIVVLMFSTFSPCFFVSATKHRSMGKLENPITQA